MPTILAADRTPAGNYAVLVLPDGSAPASGNLLFSQNVTASGASVVGTWRSPPGGNGSGEADTAGGGWLFAEQGSRVSAPFPLAAITP